MSNFVDLLNNQIIEVYQKSINYPNHEKTTENCRFLYLIRNPLTNLYKIGITNNPRLRKQQLENQAGMDLQSILILECEPNYDECPKVIEKFLHNYFKHKRVKGEWFNLSLKNIIAIRNLIWKIEGDNIWDNTTQYLTRNVHNLRIHETY